MKVRTLLLVCWFSVEALAGSLPRAQVAAEAKWLIHLDVDALLETQLGKFIGREWLDPKATKLTADLKQQFDIELDWHQIHSLTAYGVDFKDPKANGVLLVRSDLDLAGALAAVVEKLGANPE